MFRISKLADYATVLLSQMAKEPAQLHSASALAALTSVNVPTVSKILKLLAEAKLLRSVRGAQGGYGLATGADAISMADIITAIDGVPAVTECCRVNSDCSHDPLCGTRPYWQLINSQIVQVLKNMSLADIIQNCPATTCAPLHFYKKQSIKPQEHFRGK